MTAGGGTHGGPPSSPFIESVDISGAFNADRVRLESGLACRHATGDDWSASAYGTHVLRGIAFDLGNPGTPNVICLDPASSPAVRIDLPGARRASYVLFLHAAADVPVPVPPGMEKIGPLPTAGKPDGNAVGALVSRYTLVFADGARAETAVHRRLAIQQRHIAWSASPFTAVPARAPFAFRTASEEAVLGRAVSMTWGRSEQRASSGRLTDLENLWLHAMVNPHPERDIVAILLDAESEPSLIYGIATTTLDDHPLRQYRRGRLKLRLPEGAKLTAVGDIEPGEHLAIDLGTVISARAALRYDAGSWAGPAPEVQPARIEDTVVVEYAAHPKARLHVRAGGTGRVVDLAAPSPGGESPAVEILPPSDIRVAVRIVDRESGQPTPVRLHMHDENGEYLAPRGYHRKPNPYWFEDRYGELVNGLNQYAYVPGACEIELPAGRVFVEISRGYEVAPLRTAIDVSPEMTELVFHLDRVLDWRRRGWVSADTHVHFLSPQTALLEGQAEGVNVVNLLAAQWGEMFSNVPDFDGRTTLGAKDFGGDGEFVVRVGSENRMQVLGHISLLGYSGPLIQPLSTGGPHEGAIGEALEVSMADWARRCLDQGGLVVLPHAPNPQAERAADIVLGVVDAMEMMTFNPRDAQVNPYGLADWYRYQNLGYQLPIVGGSDKMAATSVLGGIRTYVHLGRREFTYGHWMAAVRQGNTFVTVGPLIEFTVEGRPAGSRLQLPASGGTVTVSWKIESVAVTVTAVELVVGGETREAITLAPCLKSEGSLEVRIDRSTWIALRLRGSYRGRDADIAAHTSTVQALVGDAPIFETHDAVAVLQQIEGTMAFVDTLAARPDDAAFARIRHALEDAHRKLHARLHAMGAEHHHSPLREH